MDHCDHGICYVSGRHGGVWLEDDPDDNNMFDDSGFFDEDGDDLLDFDSIASDVYRLAV